MNRENTVAQVRALSHRIAGRDVRGLFVKFCHEVTLFSGSVEVEASAFELAMREPCGFTVILSPLRELFLVSLGEDRSTDVRVSSEESFVSALDLTLARFLAVKSKPPESA